MFQLVHRNFHGFTSGMVKLQEYNSLGPALYMEISMDLPVVWYK